MASLFTPVFLKVFSGIIFSVFIAWSEIVCLLFLHPHLHCLGFGDKMPVSKLVGSIVSSIQIDVVLGFLLVTDKYGRMPKRTLTLTTLLGNPMHVLRRLPS